MTDLTGLPSDWVVWNDDEDGRLVLAYRPDVFDGDGFPPACLPTLYVTHGRRTRRPGRNPTSREGRHDWYVTFYLEPEVVVDEPKRVPTREEARSAAVEVARAFAAGEIDPRGCYQVPRPAYLAELDRLTG